MEVTAPRYTMEQLMRGLRLAVAPMNFKQLPIEEETRLMSIIADDDLIYLVFELERIFDIKISRQAFNASFLNEGAGTLEQQRNEFESRLTFGTLAEFIGTLGSPPSFETVTLLGRPCEKAGLFFGMEKLVAGISRRKRSIAPSTEIRSRLKGRKLHLFLQQLQIIFGDEIPGIKSYADRNARIVGPLTLICVPIVMIATFLMDQRLLETIGTKWQIWPFSFGVTALFSTFVFTWFAWACIDGVVDRIRPSYQLPPEICTFRDLAELIVKSRIPHTRAA